VNKIDEVDEETFRDAKSIIELLKENLTLWKEEEGEKEKEVRVGVEVEVFFDRKTRGERKENTFERAHFHLLPLF
jgi:hypothetical protein